MANSINLSLTDELLKFVYQNTGKGTLYSTPSEFLRTLLREKKERIEAANLRLGILEGYDDIRKGRVIEFKGSLNEMSNRAKKKFNLKIK